LELLKNKTFEEVVDIIARNGIRTWHDPEAHIDTHIAEAQDMYNIIKHL
jgi:hypothetical protein